MVINYLRANKNRNINKLILKYLKEGYITEEELIEHGKEDEWFLVGLGKTRKLSQRMEHRLKVNEKY